MADAPSEARVPELLARLAEATAALERRAQETEQYARWLAAIHSITEKISRAPDPNAILGEALDILMPLLDMDLGSVHVGDPEGQAVILAAYRGIPAELAREMNIIRRGDGLVGAVAEKGQSRAVAGIGQLSGPLVRVAQKTGMKCLAAVPLKAQDKTLGVLSLGSLKKEQVSDRELQLLESLGGALGVALEGARLFEAEQRQRAVAEALARSLEQDKAKLEKAYIGVASLVADTLVRRHPYLRGHPGRVAHHATRTARQLGLSQAEVDTINRACALFDLGLIATPDEGVRQLDPLVLEKDEGMKQHPVTGEEMVRHLGFLEDTIPLIRHHHERVDGQGYPDGLIGEGIPLGARIIAIADTWDRLTMDWPHRPGLAREEAVALLRKRAGANYDLKVMEAFLATLQNP